MGQKVKGYRRNVPYGKRTNLLSVQDHKKGWRFDVNPNGRVGWDMGTIGRKEAEYGNGRNDGKKRRKHVEEVRRKRGYETNGLGRVGDGKNGYQVYGEYYWLGYTSGIQENQKKKWEEKKRELKRRLERVVRRYETKRRIRVVRKRKDRNRRREKEGRTSEREERGKVRKGNRGLEKGEVRSERSNRQESRCGGIVLSGRRNVEKRRTKRIARRLEGGRNHIEIRREREKRRMYHATNSENGRKRRGEVKESSKSGKGYYGFKVTVKGTLEGSRRTITYVRSTGTVPRSTKRARVRSSEEVAKTTVGTLGVRVEYCYGLG